MQFRNEENMLVQFSVLRWIVSDLLLVSFFRKQVSFSIIRLDSAYGQSRTFCKMLHQNNPSICILPWFVNTEMDNYMPEVSRINSGNDNVLLHHWPKVLAWTSKNYYSAVRQATKISEHVLPLHPFPKLRIFVIQYGSEHCPPFHIHDHRKIRERGSTNASIGQAINSGNVHSTPCSSAQFRFQCDVEICERSIQPTTK